MLTEPLPIHIFVATSFQKAAIVNYMEDWRVDPAIVQNIIVQHIRELGIFAVLPQFERELFAFMLYLLKNSPEIRSRVKKSEEQDKARKQTRHAA